MLYALDLNDKLDDASNDIWKALEAASTRFSAEKFKSLEHRRSSLCVTVSMGNSEPDLNILSQEITSAQKMLRR